jgi:transposase
MEQSTSEWKAYQELKEQLEIHKTAGIVGIDVAKNKHFAVILDPAGQTIQPPFSFENSKAGYDKLIDRVAEAERKHLITSWVFGFEASGGYEKPLASFLSESGYDIVQVSSYAVKRHREMMTGSVDKNDAKDCVSVAYLMREGFVEYYELRGLEDEDLGVLVLLNEHLKARRMQLKLKIKQNVLKYTFPELEGFCKSVESKFAMELLTQFPTPHEIVKVGKLEFKNTMVPRLKGHRMAYYLDEVYALAETSVGMKMDRWASKALELRTYIAELRVIEQQRRNVISRIENMLATDPAYELITTIPGIGLETASVLLSQIGDIGRFGTDRQLISFAGFDLVNYQSGEYTGRPRISKRGRPLIRKVTYQAISCALLTKKPNEFNRKYREILAKQGETKDVKKKAKIKLCARMLRIVHAVLSKKEPYRDTLVEQ